MPKRRKPRDPDINVIAKSMIDRIIQRSEGTILPALPEPPVRDPKVAAIAARRAKKGGKARAAKLTPERRTEIAKKAATKRWGH